MFPPYPREMKTNTAKFKSAAILSLAFFYGNGAAHSHARSITRAWLKHAHSFDRCEATIMDNGLGTNWRFNGGFSRQPSCMAETIDWLFPMGKKILSYAK